MHEVHTNKLNVPFPPLPYISTVINITDHVTVTSCEDSFPLLSFAWRFLHLTGLFCWSLLPNWTFTSKNIQGSVWGPFLCHLPAASVNTSRPKLPSASLYFRCLLWTPGLYIPLPMWCLDWETSQASQLQCSHRTYVYTCVRAHTQSYSFSITSCFSKRHHHLSAHPDTCVSSWTPFSPSSAQSTFTSVWCSAFLDAVSLSHLTLLSLQEPLSGL